MATFLVDEPLCFQGTLEERVEKLKELIIENKTVFFGGAGVSTSSGIPDFRSSNGLYNQKNEFNVTPEYLLSKECLNHNPKMFYKFYRDKFDVRNYKPNEVHKKLAEMEDKGYLNGIITQNVDCLHQKAGSKKVAEIHGTISKNYCSICGTEYDEGYIFENEEVIPRCTSCKKQMGFIRPKVTLYGENLPIDETNKAYAYIAGDKEQEIPNANLMIVGGTSLTVSPANQYVSTYYGRYLVIINRDETPFDKYADIVFREDINEVFKLLQF